MAEPPISEPDSVSFYSGITPNPIRTVSWQDALHEISSCKHAEQIGKARGVLASQGPGEYGKIKKTLPSVTFSGTFSHRQKECLLSVTGFIVADLDHLENIEAVFNLLIQDENIWFVFRSPSGEGLKCGIRAQGIRDDHDHKKLFAAVERYFNQGYQVQIDPACKDISRLTFLSSDPRTFINPEPHYFDLDYWTDAEPLEIPSLNSDSGNGALPGWICKKIAEAAPGSQHITRLRMARFAGGIPGLDEGAAMAAMEQAVIASGAKDIKAAMKTVRDGFTDGRLHPVEDTPKIYRLTELGNAERFADRYRDSVRYVAPWKQWICFDGKRWKPGATEAVRRMAQKLVKGLYIEAGRADDQEIAAKLAKWAAASCKSSAITAMLKEAAAMLSIDPEQLDSDPHLFNCDNCTLNLKTGRLQPHDKNDFITKITPVRFDPKAEAPIFVSVLNKCICDPQLIEFVQKFCGYCLTGSTKEQVVVIFWGGGANGKTTIVTPIMDALGDYSAVTRPETFMAKKGNYINSDVAKLKGIRLASASESEDGQRLAEAAIKSMTGGEEIQARGMYKDWFEFTPEFKILLCTNHKPAIRGTDHAIWRRIRLVPFTVRIPEAEQDKDLPEKLKSELPGILCWIVKGAAMWIRDGLGYPEAIRTATTDYQSEQNIIKNFIDFQCTEQGDAIAGASDLFERFDGWRAAEGHRKITQTKFGKMLSDLGFEKTRQPGSGRVAYAGIGLLDTMNYSHPSGETQNCSQGVIQ